MYYLSQHRKLGDDVVLISQSIQNVDKQMRSVAQDFTYVRNLTKEQHGLFRLPALFIRRVFLELPTGPGVKAVQTGTFRLDVSGVAKCYDTAAGVGIVGSTGADTLERKRGLHWAYYVVGVLALIFVTVRFVPSAVASFFTRPLRAVPSASVQPLPSGRGAGATFSGIKTLVEPASGPGLVSTNSVTGFARVGGYYMICVTGGRVFRTTSIVMPIPGYVQLEGMLYATQGNL
jgi:hypothetical protein